MEGVGCRVRMDCWGVDRPLLHLPSACGCSLPVCYSIGSMNSALRLGRESSFLLIARGIRHCPPASSTRVQSQLEFYMTEERKHAILFAATILAARKLAELGDRP